MIELLRHSYKYFPYEIRLAEREVRTLLPDAAFSETSNGLKSTASLDPDIVKRLVYFAGSWDGEQYLPTTQSLLEQTGKKRPDRQATRYSAHGLHEYKGKFNPQIVRAILNILDIPTGSRVLDPFCGSGTSLLECAHLGMDAVGTDINPLAVFIANAKLASVGIAASALRAAMTKSVSQERGIKLPQGKSCPAREEYLLSWFTPDICAAIERLRLSIEEIGPPMSAPLLAVASNLLRDYSLQDPGDLRSRRRKSPLPDMPFVQAYEQAATRFIDRLEHSQHVIGTIKPSSRAILLDNREATAKDIGCARKFDCALTSPPYATALPYIDTQRLSLVWLGLIPPAHLMPLEANLIGSREVRGGRSKEDTARSTAEQHRRTSAGTVKLLPHAAGCARDQRRIQTASGAAAALQILCRHGPGVFGIATVDAQPGAIRADSRRQSHRAERQAVRHRHGPAPCRNSGLLRLVSHRDHSLGNLPALRIPHEQCRNNGSHADREGGMNEPTLHRKNGSIRKTCPAGHFGASHPHCLPGCRKIRLPIRQQGQLPTSTQSRCTGHPANNIHSDKHSNVLSIKQGLQATSRQIVPDPLVGYR